MAEQIEPGESSLDTFQNFTDLFEKHLDLFAGDLMDALEIVEKNEINTALDRVFQICASMELSFNKNFKKVYRFNGQTLIPDWKISKLAGYLLIINCDPKHKAVAQAQLHFLNRRK